MRPHALSYPSIRLSVTPPASRTRLSPRVDSRVVTVDLLAVEEAVVVVVEWASAEVCV